MKTRGKLVSGVLIAALLQGCFPHLRHTREEKFFYLPEASRPWQQLSNEIDVHVWADCDGKDDAVPAGCDDFSLLFAKRGTAIDWPKIPSTFDADWSYPSFGNVRPFLSAYGATNYRILGVSKDMSGNDEIFSLNGDVALPERGAKRRDQFIIQRLDVWHNATPSCKASPEPRLAVIEGSKHWIFADISTDCPDSLKHLHAPRSLIAFDNGDEYAALLSRPMRLFFLDMARKGDAIFETPRQVFDGPPPAKVDPRAAVSLQDISLPINRSFTIEKNTFNYPLSPSPSPTMRCKYSETRLFLMPIESSPQTTLDRCASLTRR